MSLSDLAFAVQEWQRNKPLGEWQDWQPLSELSAQSGLKIDELNYVVCMLLSYPLAFLFRLIPTTLVTLRHLVGGLIGLLFGLFCFREMVGLVVIQAFVVWILMNIGGKNQHK